MNKDDYVRTPNGVIARIIDIQDEEGQYFLNGNAVSLSSKVYISDKNITIGENFKHSPNIIDLIEVGDIISYEYPTGLGMISYENVTILPELLNTLQNGENNHEYKIKSIVTREQFKAMEYRLGDK